MGAVTDFLTAPFGGFGGSGGSATLSGLSKAKNALEGDPNGAAAQINQLMQTAFQQGNNINRTLQNEKAQSEAYYQPMQRLFASMYGTKGMMPPKAPIAPGGGAPY